MTLWKPEEDAVLLELCGQQLSYAEVGVRMGRTKSAVECRAARLGLVRVAHIEWTDQDIQRVKALRNLGHSTRAIALQLGRSLTTIRRKLSALGLSTNRARAREITPSIRVPRAPSVPLPPRVPIPKDEPAPLTTLLDVGFGECRYMPGTDMTCCGHRAVFGTSWCPHHYARIRGASQARRGDEAVAA